ncbi:MAG: putative colanic acid biosynthesis UDP-glucose lipid carrier transferase [Mariniblastus sp.]|jgi:putative colanic acid biosynthesis UDP-glucose lipid carrier transferase
MNNANPRHQIKQQETWPRLIMKSADAIAIVLGLVVLITWLPEVNSKSTIVIALVAMGIFNMAGEFVGLYRNWRGIRFEKEAICGMIAWLATLVLLGVLGHLSIYSTELSPRCLAIWFTATPTISLAFRISYRRYHLWSQSKGINTRNFAVVGINDLGLHLVRNVVGAPDLGLKFLGYYDDRPPERTGDLPDDAGTKLGKIETLVESAKNGQVQVIFITLPMRAEKRIRSLIQQLADTTASVYIVPDLFVFQMLNSRWTDIQGLPVVSVSESPLYGVDGMLKRSVDIALASTALLILSIPMSLVALAVKFTSKGPALFRQKRYGLDGKEIYVWKFRSMNVQEHGNQVKQATKNDSRLTPIGGFLRKSSLDELPQIFNVLAGQMSLVGPRPHASAHNEFYRSQIDGYMLRHKVKPGITGLAQINGCRGETETLDKMEKRIVFDHQYIREWSIWLDLKIIAKTFSVVFARQNAY